MKMGRPDGTKVPPIGAIVEYGMNSFRTGPGRYRVQSYMCALEGSGSIDKRVGQRRMRWCLEGEATHVSLVGIAGAIAPIEQCTVIGMVNWPEKTLHDERDHAHQLGIAKQRL